MKNPERVAALLDALKAECEFRFEFDAVAALVNAINDPPRAIVIDDRHQKFEGKSYRTNNSGHFIGAMGALLHRKVWESFFGEIPNGFVVHHIDGNKANNDITNLQLMSRTEHSRLHNSNTCRLPKKIFVCEMCGREYEAVGNGKNRFCSASCTQKHYKLKHPKRKICPFCGAEFVTRHSKTKYCSATCASRAYWQRRRDEITSPSRKCL